MDPERGETAASARARGVAVPDDVPDDADYMVFDADNLGSPGWVWQITRPYEFKRGVFDGLMADTKNQG